MYQILRNDWLPEGARCAYFAGLGIPAVSRKDMMFLMHKINPLLTKLVRSRWLDIGVVLRFLDLDYVSVHKHAKKKNLTNIRLS